MVIFDCNGVLVDSETMVASALTEALRRVGLWLAPETVMRSFHGRRPADVFAAIERAAGITLPPDFTAMVAADTLRRLRSDLQPVAHAAHALSWIRGPKAVASSSAPDRVRLSLEVTGLLRYFEPRLYSASHVRNGKPAPDLFLLVAKRNQVHPADCIVVEDSAAGIGAAVAAGMMPIGFVGASATPGRLATDLFAAGAATVIGDLRNLKSAITDLRGW